MRSDVLSVVSQIYHVPFGRSGVVASYLPLQQLEVQSFLISDVDVDQQPTSIEWYLPLHFLRPRPTICSRLCHIPTMKMLIQKILNPTIGTRKSICPRVTKMICDVEYNFRNRAVKDY
jgi:hypothetical protein